MTSDAWPTGWFLVRVLPAAEARVALAVEASCRARGAAVRVRIPLKRWRRGIRWEKVLAGWMLMEVTRPRDWPDVVAAVSETPGAAGIHGRFGAPWPVPDDLGARISRGEWPATRRQESRMGSARKRTRGR